MIGLLLGGGGGWVNGEVVAEEKYVGEVGMEEVLKKGGREGRKSFKSCLLEEGIKNASV